MLNNVLRVLRKKNIGSVLGKYRHIWDFLICQLVENLPVMQETLVGFLGQEDLLEKG